MIYLERFSKFEKTRPERRGAGRLIFHMELGHVPLNSAAEKLMCFQLNAQGSLQNGIHISKKRLSNRCVGCNRLRF